MELLFIYALIGFFFGFNFSMDYFSIAFSKKELSLFEIIAVSILVVFPFGFIFWPFICIRSIYNGLRN